MTVVRPVRQPWTRTSRGSPPLRRTPSALWQPPTVSPRRATGACSPDASSNMLRARIAVAEDGGRPIELRDAARLRGGLRSAPCERGPSTQWVRRHSSDGRNGGAATTSRARVATGSIRSIRSGLSENGLGNTHESTTSVDTLAVVSLGVHVIVSTYVFFDWRQEHIDNERDKHDDNVDAASAVAAVKD